MTVDAPVDVVVAALDGAGIRCREATVRGGVYATGARYVVDGGDHEIDLLVNFALRGTSGGVVGLPTRVTGRWRGLPLGDPGIWFQAHRLLGRRARVDALEGWMAAGSDGPPGA